MPPVASVFSAPPRIPPRLGTRNWPATW
jgi:hypothetical protein